MVKVLLLEGQINCCGLHADVVLVMVQLIRFRILVMRKADQRADEQVVRIYLFSTFDSNLMNRKYAFSGLHVT